MPDQVPPSEETLSLNQLNAYLANERTFLAWIRTSIGIMAFGFVVEKFNFFMRQFSFFLTTQVNAARVNVASPELSTSSSLGIILVGLGALICLLAFFKYKSVEKQIREGQFERSILLEIMLSLSIISVGIFLCIYLAHNLYAIQT